MGQERAIFSNISTQEIAFLVLSTFRKCHKSKSVNGKQFQTDPVQWGKCQLQVNLQCMIERKCQQMSLTILERDVQNV